MATTYKKAVIPQAVRRAVAAKYGCPPGETVIAKCAYCPTTGHITWFRCSDGRPSAWVHFGLELDHVFPEFLGGPAVAENIVLACKSCNCSKGTKV